MSENSLLQDFITETGEHLEETERNLLRLEQQTDDVDMLNTIFRSVHTIKGSSEYLGLESIAELSHTLEGLLDQLRRGERTVNSAVIDLLMSGNDRIGVLVNELAEHQEEKSSIDDLILRLKDAVDRDDAEVFDVDDGDFGEDEYDEELFGIFVEQLKEGLLGLGQDTRQLHGGQAGAPILEKSADRLATLRSSSNYMGYEELKRVYEKWSKDVDHVIDLLRDDTVVDLKAFAQETMAANIEHVQSLFPKVSFDPIDVGGDEAPAVVESDTDESTKEEEAQSADQSLLIDFINESGEHLVETERNLLRLEQQPDDVETLNKIFRSIHTIKGSSEYLGLERIAELTHKLENLLDLMRHGDCRVDGSNIDLLMSCNDRISLLIGELDQHKTEHSSVDDLVSMLEGATQLSSAETEDAGDGELGEDEYDEELFGIFIEQLKEGISGLNNDVEQLTRGDDGLLVLENSLDRLNTLRSSSNYMGYDDLKEVYERWAQAVERVIQTLKAEEEIDLNAFANETMEANIAQVKAIFPKVAFDMGEQNIDEESVSDEPEDNDFSDHDQGGDQGLLADFIAETEEHLEETERNLLQLEKEPGNNDLLNEIFRSVHTIKGSSEYLGMERIAELSHKLESLLDMMRRRERTVDSNVIDLLMACNDRIGAMVNELGENKKEQSAIDDLLSQLESILTEGEASSKTSETAEKLIVEDDTGAVYVEEYDKELFSIFMEHFNTGLQSLADDSEQLLTGDNPLEILQRCIECLNKLHSSANYMEYDRLLNHYDTWLQQIDDFLKQQKDDAAVDIEKFSQDVMMFNINKAKSFFSSFRSVARKSDEPSEIEEEASIVEIQEEPVSNIENDEYFNSLILDDLQGSDENNITPSLDDLQDKAKNFKSLTLADIQGVEKPIRPEPIPTSDDDDMLLDKLASAFESRLGFSEIVVKQYFNEDIENNLFSEDEDIGSKEDAVKPIVSNEPQTDYDIVDVNDVESLLFSGGSGLSKKEVKLPEPITARAPMKTDRPSSSSKKQGGELKRSRYKIGRRQADKFHDRMIKQSIRVDASKIDVLMNQVGELVVSRSGFNQLFAEMRDLQLMLKQSQKLDSKEMQAVKAIANRINEATTSLGRVTSELQENVMKVRMLPIAQLFSRYPRLVHDLVRGSEKKVNLEIYGEETELDKKVIEQLTDPLIHIIRNAVDHGIEKVEERRRIGKDEVGTIRMEAYPESNYVVIEISDDGRGVDAQQIKQRALEKEFITAEEAQAMSDEELLTLIMRPGFSTTDEVTTTSGRGVGMDVVKDNIEKLNGTIDIVSSIGGGARFQIKIPLTLAIIPALLVRVVDEVFTIPLSTVDETIRIHNDDISTIEGLEVYDLRGNTVPLIRLEEALNMGGGHSDRREQFVVIVNTGDKQVGFIVDELKGRQEVVIKPLEDYLQEKSGFSGATILGDGNISLILDVFEMVQISLGKQVSRARAVTS